MMRFLGARKLAFAGFAICTLLILIALYLQYVVHLEPCPLCMMQRIAFFFLALIFLIAALHGPGPTGMKVYGVLTLLVAATGLGLATRHVYLQWYPPEFNGCTADLFFQLERFPILSVVGKALRATGDCAKVDWRLLGLSIAQWSWLWFLALAALCVRILFESFAAARSGRRHA
jgi:disulfide bond formation protein DsbB